MDVEGRAGRVFALRRGGLVRIIDDMDSNATARGLSEWPEVRAVHIAAGSPLIVFALAHIRDLQ